MKPHAHTGLRLARRQRRRRRPRRRVWPRSRSMFWLRYRAAAGVSVQLTGVGRSRLSPVPQQLVSCCWPCCVLLWWQHTVSPTWSRPVLGRLTVAGVGSARLGSARPGSADCGWRRLGSARLGSAWLGPARLGSARLGSDRLGSARLGSARPGSARLGSARARARARARAWLGSARLGSARLGSGSARARLGLGSGSGSARLGSALPTPSALGTPSSSQSHPGRLRLGSARLGLGLGSALPTPPARRTTRGDSVTLRPSRVVTARGGPRRPAPSVCGPNSPATLDPWLNQRPLLVILPSQRSERPTADRPAGRHTIVNELHPVRLNRG